MPSGEIAIEAIRLSKSFFGQCVLDSIDLAISTGEIVAIVGPNGSGKTTLLRCLASVLRPSSGEVLWFGRSPHAEPQARRLVGALGHECGLYPNLTVRENLLFAARMCDVRGPVQRVAKLLMAAGLHSQADRPVHSISRGMRQKLAILRALVHDPLVALFDEPTTGLDTQAIDWLVQILRERLDQGCATCIATHDENLVNRLADRVMKLQFGELIEIQKMTKEHRVAA